MQTIAPKTVRYIKLGEGGRWAKRALAQGELPFGYASVPHAPCAEGRWDEVEKILVLNGIRKPERAKDAVREIRDFYTQGPECLWITFAEAHLWWAFAEPGVQWIAGGSDYASRLRRVRDGWRKTDMKGNPLPVAGLSTRLTQLAAYRQTICSVKPSDYLLRRINGIEDPLISRAQAAQKELTAIASEMIAQLHWADFELLVDLIFARAGWQRVSQIGGTQADVDLMLRQPATGELAFVQVKSKARQSVLDDYLKRFDEHGACARMFFVCHSPQGRLQVEDRPEVHVWAGESLAEMTVATGLFGWLIERVS